MSDTQQVTQANAKDHDCWACGAPAFEAHHVTPQRAKAPDKNLAAATPVLIPLCRTCHDMVDRVPLERWMHLIFQEQWPRTFKVYFLKSFALLQAAMKNEAGS